MTFKDWVDLIQGVAVIVASGVALWGINSWRREFVGKRKMELAEEVLTLFYQAKDCIDSIRAPAYWSSESSGRAPASHESPDQRRIRDDAFVTRARFNKHIELFSRIHALRYRFMAQFGKDAGEPFERLKSSLDKLLVALHQWERLTEVKEENFTTPEALRKHQERVDKYECVLWGGEESDPILNEVNAAIAGIEQICHPHMACEQLAC